MQRALIFFGIAGIIFGVTEWRYRSVREYAFAFGLGTLLTFAILGFARSVFAGQAVNDPFAVALGIVCVAAMWRMLFGAWTAHIKVTVLGTFVGLMTLHMLWPESPEQLKAHIIAIFIALIPAGIWCALFLQEHKQKKSTVLLMFFAGMLSTVPILFYDALVRSGAELQFFLFRITPESFSRSSSAFVSGSLAAMPDIKSTLVTTFITFMIVGLIEESSKMWVVSRSARVVVSSIDVCSSFRSSLRSALRLPKTFSIPPTSWASYSSICSRRSPRSGGSFWVTSSADPSSRAWCTFSPRA
jgi:hypothetical protein